MQRRNVFLVGLLMLVLVIPTGFSAAQDGGMAFPSDAGDAYVLFPDVVVDAPAGMGTLQQQYIVLAKAGNIMSVTATMSAPGVVTRVELLDANGMVLGQGAVDAASPTTMVLSYEAAAEGWYTVSVSLGGPLSPTNFYSLALTGTTRAVYDVLGVDAPPSIPGAHLVVGTAQINGMLEANPQPFVFPLAAGDALVVNASGASQPRLRITTFDDSGAAAQTLIAEAPDAASPASYSFVSDKAQWVRIDVEPGTPGAFALSVTLPRASGMVSDLGAGSIDMGVSMGGSGALCNGIPARFAVGDTIIVSQEGDNLLLLKDYNDPSSSVALAVAGDLFEVVGEPVCHFASGYGEESWFWEVFSFDDAISGWVQDGSSVEGRWVCAQDNPNCNQSTTCDLPHAQVGVGDMLVVSQTGDNLQIMRYAGANEQVLGLLVWNDTVEVLAEPVCYYSDWHGSGLWYWNVYSEKHGFNGWIVDGTDDETWVCPASNPTCDQ